MQGPSLNPTPPTWKLRNKLFCYADIMHIFYPFLQEQEEEADPTFNAKDEVCTHVHVLCNTVPNLRHKRLCPVLRKCFIQIFTLIGLPKF